MGKVPRWVVVEWIRVQISCRGQGILCMWQCQRTGRGKWCICFHWRRSLRPERTWRIRLNLPLKSVGPTSSHRPYESASPRDRKESPCTLKGERCCLSNMRKGSKRKQRERQRERERDRFWLLVQRKGEDEAY